MINSPEHENETYYSELALELLSADKKKDFADFHNHFKNLSASAIDFEIRTLGSIGAMNAFLCYIEAMLKAKMDFDLVQTYLNIFLKVIHI